MVNWDWVQNKETNEKAIQIKEGFYKDVIYIYIDGKVILKNKDGTPLDLEESEAIPIDFKYEVLYNPDNVDINSTNFKNVLGDIFMEMLHESIDNDSYRLVDENRNDNTEQFGS